MISDRSKVFLTGVTGFVGKVALEELIRRRVELSIDKVYIIIRKGKNKKTGEDIEASDRFKKEVSESPCFKFLPVDWQKYVEVVSGDLTKENFGLSDDSKNKLIDNVTHIINCAASVDFDLPIEQAASSNITSALNVLKFSKSCKRLKSFVNVSTAYVSPNPGNGVAIPEELVNLPFDPEEIYNSIINGTADQNLLMKQTGHPNTYTLTKCISEHLLTKYKENVPLYIVRPSIISASWKYPYPGWIDSYAAFAGFVSLLGLGFLKCINAESNTVLDIVPCDDVVNRVVDTAFNIEKDYNFIQHVVSGINRGCRIDTCISGVESFFQSHPVQHWAKVKHVSNNKSIKLKNFIYHKIPSKTAHAFSVITNNQKNVRKIKSLTEKLEYLDTGFTYFTHNSFYFNFSKPINLNLDQKQYIHLACKGIYENLMKFNYTEVPLAGKKHNHPKKDLKWVKNQPKGNIAIRTAAYVVKKGIRKSNEFITFDKTSFENAVSKIKSDSLVVIVPTHRSYMDFLLCSYLFFSHPELNIQMPKIAAASDFSKIPFLGWFFKQTHAFYIERGKGKEDPGLTKKINELVDKNETLEFFIEGARSRSRQFLKPKRGILRALQNTGVTCSILPISINYDLVPEERSFLKELKAFPKDKMKIGPLLKWSGKVITNKIKLGRVHISCGNPVIMNKERNVHNVSFDIMKELQKNTTVSDFHLKSFIDLNNIKHIDIEWIKNSIEQRNGTVIKSSLKDTNNIDPLIELTMRYQWMHHFYSDLKKLNPDNIIFNYHISKNDYTNNELNSTDFDNNENLKYLIQKLFEPLYKEYIGILDLVSKNDGIVGNALTIVKENSNSFLPFVEESLEVLKENNIIKDDKSGDGFVKGENWNQLNKFYSSCHWFNDDLLKVKLG